MRDISLIHSNTFCSMLLYRIILIVLSMSLFGMLEAQSFYTRSVDSRVKTVQVIAGDDFRRLPIIDLEGNVPLTISFDFLSEEQPWIDYTIVHCDAKWEKDNLSEMDYLEYSYLPMHVEEINSSFNTFLQYYHYEINFPTAEIRPLISGNYAVLFHYQDEPDSLVAIACFMVSEGKAFVQANAGGNTDIDYLAIHQQLNMEITWQESKLPNLNPASELNILVRQNGRCDNQRWLQRPSRMDRNKVWYEHQRDLIFEAGNHWRRFEFTDERYPGLGVDHVRHHDRIYHAYLNRDKSRSTDSYRYDQDQHGRYLIHALHVDDEKIEAEYFLACFTLDAPQRLDAKGIYLVGDFTHQIQDSSTRMEYDFETGLYHKEILLKEGAYNYQYLVPAAGEMQLTTAIIEGNHYETPNEYQIFVYYHPFGSRTDRLLGYGLVIANE